MSTGNITYLIPPLYGLGEHSEFQKSGRTLGTSVSPRDDSVAVFPTPNVVTAQNKSLNSNSAPIYTAAAQQAPASERRLFLTDTSVIFALVQKLVNEAQNRTQEYLQSEEALQAMRKLAIDYSNYCKECWVYSSSLDKPKPEPVQFNPDHYRKLFTCFSLFTLLYLPQTGLEEAPVGDELMDWLNTHYIEPSTEEGDHLSKLDAPWEDDNFWPYLTRATLRGLSKASAFFLGVLAKSHPSLHLQRLAEHLVPLLTNHPRLHHFTAERDFVIASRRWKDKVKTLRIELDHIPEKDRDDGFENWWDCISDIVGILEGRQSVLKSVCQDLGADWKEVCVAWGIFVDPRMRRQDLPDVVVGVLDDLPPDPTDLEDVIHSLLFLGRPKDFLSQASQLDLWLSAHLSDFLQLLDLVDQQPDDSGVSLRQRYILSFAEYLHTDPGLWRLTVDYLCTCGEVGEEMADQVLTRVPLGLESLTKETEVSDDSQKILSGDLPSVLKELNKTCHDYRREGARRTICRIAARKFLDRKYYALAVSYSISAEDWPGLGRIVDRVLDSYITRGPAEFARLVANIAPSLNAIRTQPGTITEGVFLYRLKFAVHFAEFHHLRINGDVQEAAFLAVVMLRDDIAPKSWWAVVLSDITDLLQHKDAMLFTPEDACLFLRKLEEISMRSAQGSESDYIMILSSALRGENNARGQLETVRLALVKYYAKCGLIGVGGRVAPATRY